MRPDELSALAAIDLLEMMFKSGVIAVRRLARSIDEVFRDAVCRLQDFLSQAKVTFSRSGWHPQGVPNSKRFLRLRKSVDFTGCWHVSQ